MNKDNIMSKEYYQRLNKELAQRIQTLEGELKVTKEKLESKWNDTEYTKIQCPPNSLSSSGKTYYENKEKMLKTNINYYTDLWKDIHNNFPE